MKYVNTRFLISVIALVIFWYPGNAQDDCEVLLEELQGEYEGDCRRGRAHGEGTAKGEATYEGEFRRGLPHGEGKYTYANGDIYEGEFRKGEKDGEGTMKILQDDGTYETKTGFWENGEYIGQYEEPYDLQYRTPDVLSVRVNKRETPEGEQEALFIEILHKGRSQPSPGFQLDVNTGSMVSRFPVGVQEKVLIAQFPFGFTINYMGETVQVEVFEEASWDIRIDFNK